MSAAAGTFPYEEPGKIPSAVLAVLVHLLLAVFLFFGVHWQSHEPEAVTVELWDSLPAPVAEKVEPAPEVKPEPQPEIKPEPKAVEKVVEPPKPDIALEKKKQVKKEPSKNPQPMLNPDLRNAMRAQAERETVALNQQREKDRLTDKAQHDAAEAAAAAYAGKLKGKIKSNIVLPPDIPGNPEALFDVVQLPTGEVMSVKQRKSSGYAAYDAAVERAIWKSSPLPKPDRPEQFVRNLEIRFRPLD
jgi:colicin import membrane protein